MQWRNRGLLKETLGTTEKTVIIKQPQEYNKIFTIK